jgi:hypothetical protein
MEPDQFAEVFGIVEAAMAAVVGRASTATAAAPQG